MQLVMGEESKDKQNIRVSSRCLWNKVDVECSRISHSHQNLPLSIGDSSRCDREEGSGVERTGQRRYTEVERFDVPYPSQDVGDRDTMFSCTFRNKHIYASCVVYLIVG